MIKHYHLYNAIPIRLANGATSDNAGAVVELIEDRRTESLIFFASAEEPTEDYTAQDGLAVNLPVMAVLAIGRVLGPVRMAVVGDDPDFLMAVRSPRLAEVKHVLDKAVASGKARFAPERAPFTAHLSPEEARNTLARLETEPLNEQTVGQFQTMMARTGW